MILQTWFHIFCVSDIYTLADKSQGSFLEGGRVNFIIAKPLPQFKFQYDTLKQDFALIFPEKKPDNEFKSIDAIKYFFFKAFLIFSA